MRPLCVFLLFFCIVKCEADAAPQDLCKTGDDGETLKDCRRTTEVEKCPNQTEFYDKKFDGVTVCCCTCPGPGYLTDKDSGSVNCHLSPKPSQKPDFPSTSAHLTPEKANTETRFDDTSTVPLKGTPDPETTSLPPETATTPDRNTSDPNVTSTGQESDEVNSHGWIVGIVCGVIAVLVLIFVIRFRKSVYPSCKNLNENGRRGQNLENGVAIEMGEIGKHAEDQDEARNDDGGNGDIDNQDAEAQRNLLEANAPQSSA